MAEKNREKNTKKSKNSSETAGRANKSAKNGNRKQKESISGAGRNSKNKKTKTGEVNKKSKQKKTSKVKSSKYEIEKRSDDLEEIDPDALERGDEPMTIVGHLDEFRSRLFRSLLTIIIVTLASFVFSENILNILTMPYSSSGLKLNVFNITEGFLLRLKASLIAGLLAAFPVIIYEVWKYIEPAINKNDRRFSALSIFAGLILFYGGITFAYLVMLPFAIKMLLSFTPSDMQNMQNASNYLSFVLLFSLGMGVLFELPIIIMVLTRIGIITPQFLISKRKYAIVLIFVIAAVITPPDVLTQLMLAIPLILLYEISIIISKFIVIRKHKKTMKKRK